jgi:hypothetical protein
MYYNILRGRESPLIRIILLCERKSPLILLFIIHLNANYYLYYYIDISCVNYYNTYLDTVAAGQSALRKLYKFLLFIFYLLLYIHFI